MIDYPLEQGQRMIVKPNKFGLYEDWGHRIVLLFNVISTEKGIIAYCHYYKEQREYSIEIPLFLLWRIADDEDLLEIHENYIHSKNITNSNGL